MHTNPLLYRPLRWAWTIVAALAVGDAAGQTPAPLTGTVVLSRSYTLPANIHGRPKQLFVQAGQLVRRGEILVKSYEHTFTVAPADAIVLQRLVKSTDFLQPASPVALLASVAPFHVAVAPGLPLPAVGRLLRLESVADASLAATAVVLAQRSEKGRNVLELRLRSLGPGPMPVGTAVRVKPLQP